MATIVNTRDVALQATVPRLLPVVLAGNVSVPNAQVTGLGTLAQQNKISLSTDVTGYLSVSNISGLSSLAYSSYVYPSQIASGALPSGVTYTGYISASQISGGILNTSYIYGTSITGNSLIAGNMGFSPSGRTFEAQTDGTVWAASLKCQQAKFNNNTMMYPLWPIYANSSSNGYEAIVGEGMLTDQACHGVRGRNNGYGSSGLVGVANGYDFYADGTGTNYGPFTGTHDVLFCNDDIATEGDIVIDVACVERSDWSGTVFEVTHSTTPNQPALGVICRVGGPLEGQLVSAFTDHTPLTDEVNVSTPSVRRTTECYEKVKNLYTVAAANALGEGQMNVCGEGGNLANGDLIVTSSMRGKGMRQADNLVRSYTVAKSREPVTFDFPSQVKIVACIYLCG